MPESIGTGTGIGTPTGRAGLAGLGSAPTGLGSAPRRRSRPTVAAPASIPAVAAAAPCRRGFAASPRIRASGPAGGLTCTVSPSTTASSTSISAPIAKC